MQKLERGDVPLEESVTIYERGEALKRRCEELLRQAEARVEITLEPARRHHAAGRELGRVDASLAASDGAHTRARRRSK